MADSKGLLRFITCGSVDDGKSTLLGRLLYDAGMVPDDQLAAILPVAKQIANALREQTGMTDYNILQVHLFPSVLSLSLVTR